MLVLGDRDFLTVLLGDGDFVPIPVPVAYLLRVDDGDFLTVLVGDGELVPVPACDGELAGGSSSRSFGLASIEFRPPSGWMAG